MSGLSPSIDNHQNGIILTPCFR